MPLVSVCMLTKNAFAYVGSAVRSIVGQTLRDWELILVDGGSTDGTVEVVESFKDRRIRILASEYGGSRVPGAGVPSDRNCALRSATGKYVAWLDSDDISASRRLELQVSYMEAHEEIAASGSWAVVFGDERATFRNPVSHEGIRAHLLFTSPLVNSSSILRRDVISARDLWFDEEFSYGEDYDFWQRLSEGARLANQSKLLVFYRSHGGQTTKQVPESAVQRINLIRLRGLRRLVKDPTDAEVALHQMCAEGFRAPRLDAASLLQGKRWLERLVDSNRKLGIYDDEALAAVTREQLVQGFRRLLSGVKSVSDRLRLAHEVLPELLDFGLMVHGARAMPQLLGSRIRAALMSKRLV